MLKSTNSSLATFLISSQSHFSTLLSREATPIWTRRQARDGTCILCGVRKFQRSVTWKQLRQHLCWVQLAKRNLKESALQGWRLIVRAVGTGTDRSQHHRQHSAGCCQGSGSLVLFLHLAYSVTR